MSYVYFHIHILYFKRINESTKQSINRSNLPPPLSLGVCACYLCVCVCVCLHVCVRAWVRACVCDATLPAIPSLVRKPDAVNQQIRVTGT